MRGFPPLHLLLLTLIFVIIGVPLYRLTSHAPAPSAPSSPPEAETSQIKAYLRLKYAHKPTSVRAMLGEKDLLKGMDLSTMESEPEVAITIPHRGAELMLRAEWPAGTPNTALTLEIEPEGLDTKSETRWTAGTPELNEVLLFEWP